MKRACAAMRTRSFFLQRPLSGSGLWKLQWNAGRKRRLECSDSPVYLTGLPD